MTVYERYLEKRAYHIGIHDRDLRRWALQEARQIKLSGFKASPSWLYDFKSTHSTVSRKILRFLSPRMVIEEVDIEQRAEDFVRRSER